MPVQTGHSVPVATLSASSIPAVQAKLQGASIKNSDLMVPDGTNEAAISMATPPSDMPTAPILVLSTIARLRRRLTPSTAPFAVSPGFTRSECPWPYMSMSRTTKPRRANSSAVLDMYSLLSL